MQATVIMNPRSGKRKATSIAAMAEQLGLEAGMQVQLRTVEGPGHGTELARAAVAAGHARVICLGGDGTLNAVARGLVGSSTALGVVAMGSGNGYARSLKLPLEPAAALHRAFTGTPAAMDVCYLNDELFLGTAGIGFDARVAHRFDRSKSRGMLGYARIIVQEIFGAEPMPVQVHVNGVQVADERVLMLVLCNTREFGNGADISPGSKPDDGLAELRIVRKPGFFALFKAFFDIYTHRADSSPHVRNITVTEAKLRQPDVIAHLDGEPFTLGQDLHFRLAPGALLVVR